KSTWLWLNDRPQPLASGAERVLDNADFLTFRKNPSEIAVTPGQRADKLSQWDRDRDPGNARYGQSLATALDPIQNTFTLYWQHEYSRRTRVANAGNAAAQAVHEYHLFQAYAVGKAQHARAKASYRAGREFKHEYLLLSVAVIKAYFGMNRTVAQSERDGRALCGRDCCGNDSCRQTRRGDEQGFFKCRAIRHLWFIEYGGHGEVAVCEQPIDAQFPARHVFNKDRLVIWPLRFPENLANLDYGDDHSGFIIRAQ